MDSGGCRADSRCGHGVGPSHFDGLRTGYPNKPIRIVSASAGGGADFHARLVAQGIAGPLGQPVIVDNRAAGILATEIAAEAPPDGYILLVTGAGSRGQHAGAACVHRKNGNQPLG